MTRKTWAFEDLSEGTIIDLGAKTVTAEDVIAFASEFDPQPMHLDAAAGGSSILGGLSASGWHTCCIFMRLMCDAFLLDSTSQGAPGVDHVKWKRPVLAGDRLTGELKVVGSRMSKSRPTVGLVTLHAELFNRSGESVFELQNTAMFLTRAAAAA